MNKKEKKYLRTSAEKEKMQYLFEDFVANFYKKHKDEHDYEVYPQIRLLGTMSLQTKILADTYQI